MTCGVHCWIMMTNSWIQDIQGSNEFITSKTMAILKQWQQQITLLQKKQNKNLGCWSPFLKGAKLSTANEYTKSITSHREKSNDLKHILLPKVSHMLQGWISHKLMHYSWSMMLLGPCSLLATNMECSKLDLTCTQPTSLLFSCTLFICNKLRILRMFNGLYLCVCSSKVYMNYNIVSYDRTQIWQIW